MTGRKNYMPGWQRSQYGFVTTWINSAAETLVVTRVGNSSEAMRELVSELEAIDPSYRLLCYSTPDTILTDLYGRELNNNRMITPEENVLSRIGRIDLRASAVGAHQPEAALDGSRPRPAS